MLRHILRVGLLLLGLCSPMAANAQGSIPIALQQVSDQNGHPLVGALLYFYQVGTVATRQDSFQDTGLTIPNQWPLPTDAYGRVPMFYLASGSIHVRLTDANGLQLFDYPNMLVIGPSGGGGGGGTSVDPTAIASSGDFKWRPTNESLTGWVKANGLSVGSAISGATGRANSDTQSLFIYLWTNCHLCTVSTGKGATALADFNANKTITVPDCRARICGLGDDAMGNSAAGILQASNITSAGDTVTTDGALAGVTTQTLAQANLPSINLTSSTAGIPQNTGTISATAGATVTNLVQVGNIGTIQVPLGGSGTAFPTLSTAMLGTWYVKL